MIALGIWQIQNNIIELSLKVSLAWIINRKYVILGVNYTSKVYIMTSIYQMLCSFTLCHTYCMDGYDTLSPPPLLFSFSFCKQPKTSWLTPHTLTSLFTNSCDRELNGHVSTHAWLVYLAVRLSATYCSLQASTPQPSQSLWRLRVINADEKKIKSENATALCSFSGRYRVNVPPVEAH